MEVKKVVITGGSRGIGEAIALKLAGQGMHIAILAKTTEPQPKLKGTIYSVAEKIELQGGKAYPHQLDIRDDAAISQAISTVAGQMGGIDILINNASAISLTNTEDTSAKRFDLMFDINVRGTFLVTQACIPHLRKSSNPHILTLSPPLSVEPRWFENHVAYTISKYTMSLLTLGWAAELKEDGIAANSLWPATLIGTAAIENMAGGDQLVRMTRKPQIMADAASLILEKNARDFTGNFVIDEDILKQHGITDFSSYDSVPGMQPLPDLFIG